MDTKDLLKYRTSTREYKNQRLEEDTVKKVSEIINEETKKLGTENLEFILNTDGDTVYN